MSEQKTDMLRAIRLAQAVLDDDQQIARLVMVEAADDGRTVPMVMGALQLASSLIEATGKTNREAAQSFLDDIAVRVLDD